MAKQRRVTVPSSALARKGARADEKVMIAYPYGTFEGGFVNSLVMALVYDARHHQRICNGGYFLQLQTTNIPHGRNQIVRTFLDETEADWLWFIDTDQTFAPDTLERMLQSAHPKERPILGALVFSFALGDAQQIVPTIWTIRDGRFARIMQVPKHGLLQLAATGTGCVLIHRSALEAVRDLPVAHGATKTFGDTSWPWFKYSDWENDDGEADVMGEDLTFFIRAAAAGFPPIVDTGIEVGHVKRITIGREQYESQPIDASALPNFAIIPVKGHHELTDALVDALVAQDEVDGIFILDNASDTDPYHSDHGDMVSVLPAQGLNIHEMWNLGIERCILGAPRCNLAILNNDLIIGDGFLSGLARELRADPRRLAVSPNYDGRVGTGFEQVHGICAARYDGTGGLAGFAFMVPGEMYAAGFPLFDTKYQWWFGDNDMVLRIEQYGGVYGIALDVTVKHLGGATTVHDEAFELAIQQDKAHFMETWGLVDA